MRETPEQKAELASRLAELVNRVPPSIARGGTIQAVRAWKERQGRAAKVLANRGATLRQLRDAIADMERAP